MKFIKLLILLSSFSVVLNSCSSLSEAGKVMRNEKVATNDEFLIEKKGALTQPPDFQKMPEPGSMEDKSRSKKNSIEEIIKTKKTNSSGESQTKTSSTEETILRQIKK